MPLPHVEPWGQTGTGVAVAVAVAVMVKVVLTVIESVFWVDVVTVVYTTEVAVIVGEASVRVVKAVVVVVDKGILVSMQEHPADKMDDAMPERQEEKGLRLVVVVVAGFEVFGTASRFALNVAGAATVTVIVIVVDIVLRTCVSYCTSAFACWMRLTLLPSLQRLGASQC
jgi:hypothetical protein